METWVILTVSMILGAGFFFLYRKDVEHLLTAAADVMHEYNDQYNHDLDDDKKDWKEEEEEGAHLIFR